MYNFRNYSFFLVFLINKICYIKIIDIYDVDQKLCIDIFVQHTGTRDAPYRVFM